MNLKKNKNNYLFLFILISFINIFVYLFQKVKRDKNDKMLDLLF